MIPGKAAYLTELARRAKESHIYRQYQLLGLEIATTLSDERHKSLYIKLAKEHGGERLLRLAKEVAERRDVKNRGAYFMTMLKASFPAPIRKKPAAPAGKRTPRQKKSHAK